MPLPVCRRGGSEQFPSDRADLPAAGRPAFRNRINEGHYPNKINTNIHSHSDWTTNNGRVATVAEWMFDAGLEGWTPNAHVADVEVRDGVVHCRTTDSDPMFIRRDLELKATPWQMVAIRLRVDAAGPGQLFWSSPLIGPYGGFSAERSLTFDIPAGGEFCDIVVAPFWQAERTIRQLRLDLSAAPALRSTPFAFWTGAAGQRPFAICTSGRSLRAGGNGGGIRRRRSYIRCRWIWTSVTAAGRRWRSRRQRTAWRR